MVASNLPCHRLRLEQLLAGQLTDAGADDVTRHVESCVACRQKLESLAAAPVWWQDAQRFLAAADQGSPIAYDPAGAGAAAPAGREALPLVTAQVLTYLAPADDPALLGRLDEYEIVRVLGIGGMGIVLQGFDRPLSRHVAIKLLSPWLASNATARRRFAREAQAAAAVVHPHVVAIHHVSDHGPLPYLVMEYVAGESLQERLDQHGPLEVKDVLRIGRQVADGLAAAHAQGLVHRDVKPANILLERGVDRVRLTDFGLARAIDDGSLTRSGLIAGTPQYMSPEQARGEMLDHRSDLFSLGSVLYTMCAGHPPFRAETALGVLRRICEVTPRPLLDVAPDVPIWLAAIIERMLAKTPQDRFVSAHEVANLLEGCLAHVQHPAAIPLPDAVQRLPSRRRRTRRWLYAVAMIGASGGVAWSAWLSLGWFAAAPAPHTVASTPPAAMVSATNDSPSAEPLSNTPVPPAVRWNDGVERELLEIERALKSLELRTFEVIPQ